MTLGLTKTYTPAAGDVSDATAYNTDAASLFNAFSGLEAQTSTLGALTITPSSDGTTKFRITNAAGTELFSVDTTNSALKLKATGKLYLDGGGNTYIVEGSADTMSFYTGGTARFVINSSGDVAVSPTKKVYLDGGNNTYIAETSADTISFYTAGSANLVLNSSGDLAITSGQSFFLDGGSSADIAMSDSTHGTASDTVYIGNETIDTSAVSDVKTKKDIKLSKRGLKDILKLNVKEYRYKQNYVKDKNKKHIGLVAQEVKKIFPEAVKKRKDKMLYIDYKKLIPLLINAIKDLYGRRELCTTGLKV